MTALPETCGACKHAQRHTVEGFAIEPTALCDHQDRPVRPAYVDRGKPPPIVCPLRRVEELRRSREAGQVEGARWTFVAVVERDAHEVTCPVFHANSTVCTCSLPATVCAEARSKDDQ